MPNDANTNNFIAYKILEDCNFIENSKDLNKEISKLLRSEIISRKAIIKAAQSVIYDYFSPSKRTTEKEKITNMENLAILCGCPHLINNKK
jgi:hypothetical protein